MRKKEHRLRIFAFDLARNKQGLNSFAAKLSVMPIK